MEVPLRADAERNRILAEAYGQDPEFFAFTRSLTAYESSLQGANSSIVMQPDSEFFDYLRSDAGRPTGASIGPTTPAPAEAAPADTAPAEAAPAETAPASP